MPVFLISPANSSGQRASMLLREGASFGLARQLQSQEGAELGDLFSFASSLYFRGKLAYARKFGAAPRGIPTALVIAPGLGLVLPETRVTLEGMRAMARVPVDEEVPAYAEPLKRDVAALARSLKRKASDGNVPVVLLGSVASSKYTAILTEALGAQLVFPSDFVGRGDMSRGGMLLRGARSGTELPYSPVLGTVLRGTRPPKLPRVRRQGA